MIEGQIEGQGVLFMIINVNELASLFSDIGNWIGILLIVLLILKAQRDTFHLMNCARLSERCWNQTFTF